MRDVTMSAQVTPSQAEGQYGIAFSGDGFASSYQFFGTPAEIRALLADIVGQLAECEAIDAEIAAESEAAQREI